LPLPLVSVKELRSAGFSPDFIVCRAKKAIEVSSKNKISLFCNVDKENVLSIPDVSNIYHVPLLLLQQDFHHLLSKKLNLNAIQQEKLRVLAGVEAGVSAVEEESKEIIINKALVKSWEDMVVRIDSATDDVSIALIGKYTNQQDSYLSVISALKHSCIATDQKLKLLMIESSSLEQETKEKDPALFEAAWKSLKSADGILVPGTAHEHCAFIFSSSVFRAYP
jgi:CTP synthase